MLLDKSLLAALRIVLLSSIGAWGCGDDADDAGGAGGYGGGHAGGGPTGGGGGGAQLSVDCGEGLVCEQSVCIIEPNEPACTSLQNEADPCPEGTTKTICGGAGRACCCGPTPPPDHRCAPLDACAGATPTCACVDPCEDGDQCTPDGADGATFRCEPAPKP